MPTAFFSFSAKILTAILTMERLSNWTYGVRSMHTGVLKAIAQPVADPTLFIRKEMSRPMARLSALQELASAPLNRNSRSQPIVSISGSGERLFPRVFQSPQDSGKYRVPVKGALYLPLRGGISVRSITLDCAANAILSAYTRFLKPSLVTLRLAHTQLTASELENNSRSRSSLELSCLNSEGTVLRQDVRINSARRINEQNKPIFRENDIIVVERSYATRIKDTLRYCSTPLLRFLQCFRY